MIEIKTRIKFLLIFLLFYSPCPLFSQLDSLGEDRILTVQEMKKDITYYFKTLKEMNPTLYHRYTKEQIDSVQNKLYKDCSAPMSLFDFSYALAKTAKYTDGHTSAFLSPGSSLSKEEQQALFPGVTFEDGKIVLGEDSIYSINGIPSVDLVRELDGLVSWEYSPALKQKAMSGKLSMLLYKVHKTSPPFVCSVRKKNSATETDSVIPNVKDANKADSIASAPRYQGAVSYDYFYEDSIAVLYYNMCYAETKSFENFLEVFFRLAAVQGMKYLVIDVTQNGGGGDQFNGYVVKHLNSNPYQEERQMISTKKGAERLYKSTYELMAKTVWHESFVKKNREQIESNYPWLKNVVRPLMDKGKRSWISKNEGKTMGFSGDVFVIMGPKTYSAASDFCERIKRGGMGLLVGEECGQRIPFGGNGVYDKLPYSGLSFRFSSTYNWSEPALPTKEGFLQPDIHYNLDKLLTVQDYKEIIRRSEGMTKSLVGKQLFSVEDMREDIDYFFKTAQEIHPYLYRYYSEHKMDSVKKEIVNRCSEPLSINLFQFQLARVSKYLDATSKLYFPSVLSIGMNEYIFPYVSFGDGYMLLDRDTICTINGIPSDKLVRELDELVSWEYLPQEREKRMNDYLSVLLYKVYDTHPRYHCGIRRKNTNIQTDTVIGSVKYNESRYGKEADLYAKRYLEKPIASDIFDKDSIAVLYYSDQDDDQINNIAFLSNEFFTKIAGQKIKYLFIDITQLRLGEDKYHKCITDHLNTDSFESQMKFRASEGGALRVKGDVKKEENKKLSDSELRRLAKKSPEMRTLLSLIENGSGEMPFESKGRRDGFDGKVFVLIGNHILMSGHLFCESIKRGNMGLLVGEEIGQRLPCGGNQAVDTLPKSGLRFSIPILESRFDPALPNRDGFLIPDIPYDMSRLLTIDDYKEIVRLSNEK